MWEAAQAQAPAAELSAPFPKAHFAFARTKAGLSPPPWQGSPAANVGFVLCWPVELQMGPDRRLLNAGIVRGRPRLAQGDWGDQGDRAACASPAPWVPEGCWAPPAVRQSRDGAPRGEPSAEERAWPCALLLSKPLPLSGLFASIRGRS